MSSIRNIKDLLLNAFKYPPPALTFGLLVFMSILFIAGVIFPGINDNLCLSYELFTRLQCKVPENTT